MNIYPRVEINLDKVRNNTKLLVNKCIDNGIEVMGVTKIFCGHPQVVEAMIDGGINYIADSRVANLCKINTTIPKVLLRLPMKSEALKIVKNVDISLNSELDTIMTLDDIARSLNKVHCIILMVELGDLREGVLPENIVETVNYILNLKNIKLIGLGVNLTCYGGVIPSRSNLNQLVQCAEVIEEKFNIKLEIISGGNSSSLFLLEEENIPSRINNLRLGEAISLGRESAFGEHVEGTSNDACILKAEIIELKEKPSIPRGEIGMDAFGNKPIFEDRGVRKRAILAIGRQDVDPDGLRCLDRNAFVLGASSDHLIMDLHECKTKYKVGDTLEFYVDYSALLKIMTSEYVYKKFM